MYILLHLSIAAVKFENLFYWIFVLLKKQFFHNFYKIYTIETMPFYPTNSPDFGHPVAQV